jgi:hypothetical protein
MFGRIWTNQAGANARPQTNQPQQTQQGVMMTGQILAPQAQIAPGANVPQFNAGEANDPMEIMNGIRQALIDSGQNLYQGQGAPQNPIRPMSPGEVLTYLTMGDQDQRNPEQKALATPEQRVFQSSTVGTPPAGGDSLLDLINANALDDLDNNVDGAGHKLIDMQTNDSRAKYSNLWIIGWRHNWSVSYNLPIYSDQRALIMRAREHERELDYCYGLELQGDTSQIDLPIGSTALEYLRAQQELNGGFAPLPPFFCDGNNRELELRLTDLTADQAVPDDILVHGDVSDTPVIKVCLTVQFLTATTKEMIKAGFLPEPE